MCESAVETPMHLCRIAGACSWRSPSKKLGQHNIPAALKVSVTRAPPMTPSTVQASGGPVSVVAVDVVDVVAAAVLLVVLLELAVGAGAAAVTTVCAPELGSAVTVYVAEAEQAPNLMHTAPVRRPRLPL